MPALTEAQRAAAREFLHVVDALGAALAADKLDEFNRAAPQLHAASPALVQAFGPAAGWGALTARVEAVAHLPRAADLVGARKSFSALSLASVEWAKHLRAHEPGFAALKIFMCPMTEDAFPGAPKKGTWLQLAAPLRNPYYGAEMLECGQEVK
jgi:Cu(I)/Ag(I) efflux system membrane fusion protein